MSKRSGWALWAGGLALVVAGQASAQNLLTNPSFDDNGGSLDGWNVFGNAFADTNIFETAPAGAVLFGNFPDPPGFNVTGIFQEFPASEGINFQMACDAQVLSADPIATAPIPNSNWAVMKISFFDAAVGGAEIGFGEVVIGDVDSVQDVWTNYSVDAVSPAGTQRVEAFFLFLQPNNESGAIFIDNASFQVLSDSPTGACCDNNSGTCEEGVEQIDCQNAGNRYGGDDSTCDSLFPACGSCGENLYANPGFDEMDGSFDGWIAFGGVAIDDGLSLSPPASAKVFGQFSGGFNVSGLTQRFNISEGQPVELAGSIYVGDFDPLTGAGPPDFNWAVLKIAYFNALSGGAEIGGNEIIVADGSTPLNQWIDFSVSGMAPPGTQSAEGLFLFLQPGLDPGAVFVDNMSIQVTCPPEPEACCGSDGSCSLELADDCIAGGGTPSGMSCEGDGDGDGVDGNCGDQCPFDGNKTAPGVCGCGNPDVDSDADGVLDCNDQCPGEDDLADENGNSIPDCLESPETVPTVSTWGLMILAMLLLAAAKIRFLDNRFAAQQ
ncbi:MAG: hypothetical protein ACPGXK_01490 [Phycisphaerae bacterium]